MNDYHFAKRELLVKIKIFFNYYIQGALLFFLIENKLQSKKYKIKLLDKLNSEGIKTLKQ